MADFCDNSTEVAEEQAEFHRISNTVDVSVMTAFLSLVGLSGCVGNVLVILVCTKFPTAQTAQYFIFVMAVCDLFVCVFIIPYRITSYHVLLPEVACKTFEGLTYCSVMYSIFVLIAVAWDRYFAVCKPFSFVMTNKRTKYVSLSSWLVALGCSVPAGLIAGHYLLLQRPDDDEVLCYTGICNEDGGDLRFMSKTGIFVYSGVLGLLYFILVVCVVVLYSRVFYTLYKRFYKRANKSRVRPLPSANANVNENSVAVVSGATATNTIHVAMVTENAPTQSRVTNSNGRSVSVPHPQHKVKEQSSRAMSHKRAAKILLLVTVAFIILWIPFFLMKLHVVPNVVTIRLSFFLSNMINPVIYSFSNRQFRINVRKLFSST